jgi:hypothetical protein
MNRFWDNVIKPIIKSINASYIVEVGSDTGINTQNILEYCVEQDARMTAIDPLPKFDVDEFKAKYGDKFEIYMELSLSRLPLLENYDVILIDGDHNWYTVYNELKIIEKSFKGKKFPIIFLHDVGWPYARRDLYYNPENIPEVYRQPYKKLGMYPGQTDLKERGGLNTHLYNSIYENNPKNGTLTAVEDFIDESQLGLSFKFIKAFHGLCILFSENDEMETIVNTIIKNVNLLDNVEEERVKFKIAHSEEEIRTNLLKKELSENKTKLEHLGNQLNSSNDLIQKKEEQIENIKIQLNQTVGKLEQTQSKLNSLNDLVKEKEKQLDQTKGELNQVVDKFEQTENKFEQTQSQLKSSNELIQRTEEQLRNTKVQLNQMVSKLEQTETKLKSSNELIQEKQNIIINMEKREEKIVKKLNAQINNLTTSFLEMEYLNNRGRSTVQRLISKFPSLYIIFNMKETGFKNALINIKGYKTIKNNNLLDIGFYLKNNKSVRLSGMDPILHYMYHGFKEGKKPTSTFNGNYYLKKYNDVKDSNLNPLVHYGLYGKNEGRKTISTPKIQNRTQKLSKNTFYKVVEKDNKISKMSYLTENFRKKMEGKLKISIKIAVSDWKNAHKWGDYHFALALKKEFEKNNYESVIKIAPEWDDEDNSDVVLVLRGLNRYKTRPNQYNIMWNISHPDLVSIEEYNDFDYVFVASDLWADHLKTKLDAPVESLLQCTDPELFYPEPSEEYKHELLFVGNSRNVFRKIIKDLVPLDNDFGLYGLFWEQFVDKKYIKGDHIPNVELHKAYSSCKILLNDHWPDMAEKGFISNRLFDGFAAGAFIISDEVKGAKKIFGELVVTYSSRNKLHELIKYYLDKPQERNEKAEKGRDMVLAHHTFTNRAKRIMEIIEENKH